MIDATIIEYESWSKVILYSKMEIQTKDIKKKVHILLWDKELERIQTMPFKEVAWIVDNILNEKWIFND